MAEQRRRATEAEANALASGIRLRIIRLTYREALTNRELADRLGRDPATTLYHVRRLVDTGFLAAQPARRGTRGAREIPYLSTGLSWTLDSGGSQEISEAMLQAYLAEVADLGPGALEQIRLVLRLSKRDRAEFFRRFDELLEEFRVREAPEEAENLAIYVSTYPGD